MKKFLMIICAALLLTGCGSSFNSQKLIIGIDAEYAPFGFRNEQNEIVGFDVDLAKEVSRRLGIEFEFRPIDWNLKVEELNSGRIDMIWNGLDITPERKEFILYSKPYMDNRQILLIKVDSGLNIHSDYDLAGKTVGVQAGSTSETYVIQNAPLHNSFRDFKIYHSYINAFNALDDGEIDVLIVDELVGRYEMGKIPQKFEALEITIGSATEIGIGLRKNDTELRNRVQKVFDEMLKDGTAKKISEAWFKADLIKFRK